MKRVLRLLLIAILVISSVVCFGACEQEPEDKFPNIELNQNVIADKNHVIINTRFNVISSDNGYYDSVELFVNVRGYSQLTYYNVSVVVVFMATTVTDSSPSGTPFEHEITVRLDNNGCGSAATTKALTACRMLNSKRTDYIVKGSVTKIKVTE